MGKSKATDIAQQRQKWSGSGRAMTEQKKQRQRGRNRGSKNRIVKLVGLKQKSSATVKGLGHALNE
jgi:hypothetical protein